MMKVEGGRNMSCHPLRLSFAQAERPIARGNKETGATEVLDTRLIKPPKAPKSPKTGSLHEIT